VVFADSHGDVKILDGYCRHMGGDLTQGTIKGDEVACPFHDWRWGGDGRCKLVPYAKRTPRLARTRSWKTDVRGGLLFVWHDHEGNPPQPEVRIPEIPEAASDDWTDWRWNSLLIEGSNCRDIIDNVTDMAQFFYIHFGFPTYFKNVFEGHIASQYLHNVGRPDVNDIGTTYGEAHLDSEASYFGPSFMINWLHNNYGGYQAESILINCHYPVTQDSFVLQWGVIVEKFKGLDEAMTEKLSKAFSEGVSKGFLQDVEIWKHKTRIDNPLLVEEDGGLSDAPVVSAVLCRSGRRHRRDDRSPRDRGGHDRGQREVARGGRGEPQAPGRMNAEGEPDVDRLARSMLMHGAHDDDDHGHSEPTRSSGSWSKAPIFPADRAAALREATQRDRERYLTSGLVSVDCRFCHASVNVKKLDRATPRCSGTPKLRSVVHTPTKSGMPAVIPPAPGAVRNWRIASNTRSPKAVWRNSRPPPPPATADVFPRADRVIS
jgi:3-ketosteroid 9alpha-monooxygenase subunit A